MILKIFFRYIDLLRQPINSPVVTQRKAAFYGNAFASVGSVAVGVETNLTAHPPDFSLLKIFKIGFQQRQPFPAVPEFRLYRRSLAGAIFQTSLKGGVLIHQSQGSQLDNGPDRSLKRNG
ncbi:hypothetical protein DYU11_22290 [Fibrisoma montanum]|uniref:Uncharacterized protein n=1 Tax=Fibrisoma montanum TaxID=2305895 RepID=A0A418M517_9BACT|nr:hypothetical protein DYU11_22290 [Fibrisoma montanum]